MKLVFAAALIAAVNASWGGQQGWGGYGGYGGQSYGKKGSYAKVSYQPVTRTVQPAAASERASAGYGRQAEKRSVSDWDAYGRDQDLAIDESYGRTHAKSYAAESYDEWDNQDDDKWGAQAWGKDRDMSAASSKIAGASEAEKHAYGDGQYGAQAYGGKQYKGYAGHQAHGYAGGKGGWGGAGYGGSQAAGYQGGYGKSYGGSQAASGHAYGADKAAGASLAKSAQRSAYDNDEWAKQAYGSDFDSRWGKSYDSVQARQYDNEHYAREVRADDDQWAEDYDRWDAGAAEDYGKGASAASAVGKGGKGWGAKGGSSYKGASKGYGSDYDRRERQDWDAYGRDQDFHEKVSYDQTRAKAYAAESYDEWDNEDSDKWGAQAWGKDRDVHGASSYGKAASSGKYGQYGAGYGAGYGKGGKGWGKGPQNAEQSYGRAGSSWEGASKGYGASKMGYDNDEWAKQAYGSDADSRYGKSYDSVSARSYDNEKYARWLQADDDQWAEDYDSYDSGMADQYGRGASVWTDAQKKGWGSKAIGGEYDAASDARAAGYWGKSGSDWDAYGRDQDLEVDESYEATWAKSYDAESYDEWDNKDDDRWGAQAWGKDRDLFGASSEGARASEGDVDAAAYGAAGAYGASGARGYGSAAGAGYGHGHGGWGGATGAYGGHSSAAYGGYAKSGQAAAQGYGSGKAKEAGASGSRAAAVGAYDNDEWAKQAYGRDFDSRYGKSYDSVAANSYDDEQYARKVRADDDQWAEDYDRRQEQDRDAYTAGASNEYAQPEVRKTTYVPHVQYGSYGSYGGKGYDQW